MANKVILVGGFHEIIELCADAGFNIVGIIDNNLSNKYMDIPILGKDTDANRIVNQNKDIPFVITPDAPIIRERLNKLYDSVNTSFQSIISPFAKISISATIGKGTIIQHGVNVSSKVQIGCFVKLNTFSNIMHDCTICDYTTIAPNAVVLGRVNIGIRCYIGANSTILPDITITNDVTIGAGAVVTNSITETGTYVGIPARKIK